MNRLRVVSDAANGRIISGLNAITGYAGAAGDYYLFTDTFWRPGAINAGVSMQPSVNVTISYTLAPKEQVLSNPANVPWSAGEAVNASVINNDFPVGFTVMKITFSAAGAIYIVAY